MFVEWRIVATELLHNLRFQLLLLGFGHDSNPAGLELGMPSPNSFLQPVTRAPGHPKRGAYCVVPKEWKLIILSRSSLSSLILIT